WTQLAPSTPPSSRGRPAIAYDSIRKRIVLVGGFESTMTPLGDTWEWDGSEWMQRQPALSPEPRSAAAMDFDPDRGRVVLYGGQTAPSTSTWEWDGTNWIE